MIEAILFLCTGALAGLLSGLLGIGGGVVVVPLLASIFDNNGFPHELVMHFAAGTSLAVMIVTTSASLRAHHRKGSSVWPVFKLMMPGLVIGVIVGALVSDYLHSHVLRILFGFLLVGVSFKSFFNGNVHPTDTLPTPGLMNLGGFISGLLSGLLGIGGGATVVPFLLYIAVDLRIAVAVATACGLTAGIVGTISYILTGLNEVHNMSWTTGHIYWPAFAGVALATPLFATIGAHISHKLPVKALRRIFALFLLLMAIKLLVY